MKKIEAIKEKLAIYLMWFKNTTALYLSGGDDSVLLLNILMDIHAAHGLPFSIVNFNNSFSQEQQRHLDLLIYNHNLMVFSYPPLRQYFVGEDKKIAIVEEYAFADGTCRTFLRDVKNNSKKCIHDVKINGAKESPAPIGFKLNLFGIRKTDHHFTVGQIAAQELTKNREFLYWNPLWDFSRKDVLNGLKYFDQTPSKIDTGTSELCLKCLQAKGKVLCPKTDQMIDPIQWNPSENLEFLRSRLDIR